MTDQDALDSYAESGDAEAFRHLVLAYRNLAYTVCRRILSEQQAAEDAVQKTFVKLAQSADSIKSNLNSWPYRCAYNTALNERRELLARKNRELAASLFFFGCHQFPGLTPGATEFHRFAAGKYSPVADAGSA